jgi:hypothetical protein
MEINHTHIILICLECSILSTLLIAFSTYNYCIYLTTCLSRSFVPLNFYMLVANIWDFWWDMRHLFPHSVVITFGTCALWRILAIFNLIIYVYEITKYCVRLSTFAIYVYEITKYYVRLSTFALRLGVGLPPRAFFHFLEWYFQKPMGVRSTILLLVASNKMGEGGIENTGVGLAVHRWSRRWFSGSQRCRYSLLFMGCSNKVRALFFKATIARW